MVDRSTPPDAVPTVFPLWPLLATTAMQTLSTMSAYTIPALAPMIARDVGVEGAFVGYFVAIVYGVGIISSLMAAGLIARFGAVRVCQMVLVCSLALLVICSYGTAVSLALGAVALGVAYGATAPVSTHLLVPRTPPGIVNVVLSTRQIGVPLGGVLAATLMPPIAMAMGWKQGLMLQAIPIVALLLLLEIPRRAWDGDLSLAPRSARGSLVRSLGTLRTGQAIRRLTFASFIYSGAQLTFVAFMTVHLTTRVDFDLVTAGWALAVYQLSGVINRPIVGWVADKLVPARILLSVQGFVMAIAAVLAGFFAPGWPVWAVIVVAAIAGGSASAYTGIAYAEYARVGGAQRTEATGLGSAAMFAGVMVLPSMGSVVVTSTGSYFAVYAVIAVLAAIAATVLIWPARRT